MGQFVLNVKQFFFSFIGVIIKGAVQQDFFTSVFSYNDLPWSQKTCLEAILNFFNFFFPMELFIFKIYKNWLSAVIIAGSKKLSLRQPPFFTLLKLSSWAVLCTHGWFLPLGPFYVKESLLYFFKMTPCCQQWLPATNKAESSESPY